MTIIKNPQKPVAVPDGPKSLSLIEDLCMGDDPDADFMFEDLRAVRVDNDEGLPLIKRYQLHWE